VRRIRRTEVTVETDEIVVIRSPQTTIVPLCSQCSDAVPMITVEQAREIVSANTRAIYRWVEGGLIHHMETPDGVVFVCPRSLFLAGLMPELPGAKLPQPRADRRQLGRAPSVAEPAIVCEDDGLCSSPDSELIEEI
jgi:putative hemolysin